MSPEHVGLNPIQCFFSLVLLARTSLTYVTENGLMSYFNGSPVRLSQALDGNDNNGAYYTGLPDLSDAFQDFLEYITGDGSAILTRAFV